MTKLVELMGDATAAAHLMWMRYMDEKAEIQWEKKELEEASKRKQKAEEDEEDEEEGNGGWSCSVS